MITHDSAAALEDTVQNWKSAGQSIGFIPTMGALHEGHVSLIRRAAERADKIIVSIFVNPTQFGPNEDFSSYPRTLEKDIRKLTGLPVEALYTPSMTDIYPDGPAVTIRAGKAADGLESDFRPHFFDGVCSVVHTLFLQVRPDIAVFGEKDYQQLEVIREMTHGLSLPVRILGSPTIRDDMGLALSSRNAYLGAEDLGIARMLNQIMYGAAYGISEGVDAFDACKNAGEMLLETGFDTVDYVAYKPEWNRVLVAAWLGKTRLIDNCAIP